MPWYALPHTDKVIWRPGSSRLVEVPDPTVINVEVTTQDDLPDRVYVEVPKEPKPPKAPPKPKPEPETKTHDDPSPWNPTAYREQGGPRG